MASDHKWNFCASNTTTKQLEGFCLEDLAWDVTTCAPELSALLGMLLDGKELYSMASTVSFNHEDGEGDTMMGSTANYNSYWDNIDEIDLKGFISGLTAESPIGLNSSLMVSDHVGDKHSKLQQCQAAITMLVHTYIIVTKLCHTQVNSFNTERNSNLQHCDASCEPESQCIAKCSWHFPPVCTYPTEGHRHSCTCWNLNIN